MYLLDPHFMPVVGRMFVRDSGLDNPLLDCTIIRTHARRQAEWMMPQLIQFVEPTSGSSYYQVAQWFSDWDDERDNYTWQDGHVIGRAVEIAVLTSDLDEVLAGNIRKIVQVVAVNIDEPGVGWRSVAMDLTPVLMRTVFGDRPHNP